MAPQLLRIAGMALCAVLLASPAWPKGSSGDFHRWGLGWVDRPALRYRTSGGWQFTLKGLVKPRHTDSGSQGSVWNPDNQGGSRSEVDVVERSLGLAFSRQFHLGRGVYLGPALFANHRYARTDSIREDLDLWIDSDTYDYEINDSTRWQESWNLGLGLIPAWQINSRFAAEIEIAIRYSKHRTREIAERHRENTEGDQFESASSSASSSSSWSFEPSSISTTMGLGLFFYF